MLYITQITQSLAAQPAGRPPARTPGLGDVLKLLQTILRMCICKYTSMKNDTYIFFCHLRDMCLKVRTCNTAKHTATNAVPKARQHCISKGYKPERRNTKTPQ